ncbi:hypothetical protein ULMS_06970 [Patiriisocius marinistellae]|uniref:Secretion system C-terminal sorting domain-containing protein n=1 Tax=Patiriisocius marinistellae TaxID=2494560 RepID=A0A5J4FYF5_9FLAO|nr:T9SS type A sorting domain-containing protein [Patiriisocius marinistellae]GEQ85189.1 hypothetical protein ULMS_06970 [Patiriisocius marinistellae]
MKKITCTIGLIFLTVMTSFSQNENLSLTFSNAMLTNDGNSDFYEVDIIATRISTADFKLGDGQFYINYNPDAFGTEINNTTVDFEYTSSSILGEMNVFNIYTDPIIANRSNGIISIAFEQSLSSGSMAENNIIAAGKVLGHLKIEMINTNQDPQITFNITGTDFTNAFFTACGDTDPGPAFKNCGIVGVDYFQIIGYDGTDNSGAALPIEACSGGSTIFTTAQTWDPVVPDATMTAIIEGNYDTENFGNIEACELTIAEGGELLINPLTYVRVQNNIINDGSFSVLPTGSLVQVNDEAIVTNNTNINVTIETPTLKPRDFMVMGSPMTNATPQIAPSPDPMDPAPHNIFRILNHTTTNFTPNEDVQDEFPGGTNFVDEEGDDFTQHPDVFSPAEAYYVNPQESLQDGNKTYNILYNQDNTEGTLNNGIITYMLDYNTVGTPAENKNASPSLISNPYPSAISAAAFIAANDAVDQVYFWEHNTTPATEFPGWLGANFSMGDISMFNGIGFMPAATGDPNTAYMGDFYISTGQGFGVKSNGAITGTANQATFNNSMRSVDNNTTLRNSAEDKNRLWLHLKSTDYLVASTTLIGFTNQATPGFDASFDSKRVGTPVSLYSHLLNDSEELSIQGRETFNDAIEISLGFSSQVQQDDAAYTISLSNIDGELISSAPIYLRDNETNIVTQLNNESYAFNSPAGTFNNRFTLFFRDAEILNNQDIALQNISLYPNPANNMLHIIAPSTTITTINITDIQGRTINVINNLKTNEKTIDISTLKSAVYFITITTVNGQITRRIIKN